MAESMVYIDKVVVHMGVGEGGEKLVNAEEIMQKITTQAPTRCFAKKTQPAFGVRKGAPIGCKVSLRGSCAEEFLGTALGSLEDNLSIQQFDRNGNISFGIEEHTDFPGMSYDPKIGIYGMDVNVILENKGVRIARRVQKRRKLPAKQQVTRDVAIAFLKERFGVEVQ